MHVNLSGELFTNLWASAPLPNKLLNSYCTLQNTHVESESVSEGEVQTYILFRDKYSK